MNKRFFGVVLVFAIFLSACTPRKPPTIGGNSRQVPAGMAMVVVSTDPTVKIYQCTTDVGGWGPYSPAKDGKVYLALPLTAYYQVNCQTSAGLPSIARQGRRLLKYFNLYANGVLLEEVVVGQRQTKGAWQNDAVNWRFFVREDGSVNAHPDIRSEDVQ